MNRFEEIRNLKAGIIITDKDNIIISHNTHASRLLKVAISAGKPIKYYLPYLSSMDLHKDHTTDSIVYTFGLSDTENLSKNIFQNLENGIFISDKYGKLTFINHFLKDMLASEHESIISILNSFDINENSFKILLKTKKEVNCEARSKNKKYSLKLVPVMDDLADITSIYGVLSETHDQNRLNHELEDARNELEKYRASSSIEAFKLEKPNLKLHSKSMTELYSILTNISNRDITILLLGKSGTGKSSIAKKIHTESLRRSNQFITINCAALPENLIESELFGYDKGAFTGALSGGKKGLVEIADGGTLFIDEIGELPFHLQGKLLELIQDKTYRPVGATQAKTANIRIITATNKDLYNLVLQKKFREDLYYRIAVAVINIPPLAEHPEDIKALIDSFTLYFNKKYDINTGFSADAKKVLIAYDWPGNIRELEHIVEFLMVRSVKDTIEAADLPPDIIKCSNIATASEAVQAKNTSFTCISENGTLDDHMSQYEAFVVRECYKLHNSSYKLAKHLSISQSKANRLIQKHCK